MVRWIRCPLSPDTGFGPVLGADGVFCKTVETGERSPNSSVSESSANHCAMSPALCECQCGDYGTGLVYQHKPEGRRLTSAIISTPLWSEWPLCIFSHEFIINNFLEPQILRMWSCVSQKCECGIIHTWSPVGQSQLECENACSTSIKIIIPRLKVPVFKCCQTKLNIPLSISRKSFTYQTVFLSQPRKHLYVFYISYKAIFLYYFNWKIKICLNYDRLCKHFLWLMSIIFLWLMSLILH